MFAFFTILSGIVAAIQLAKEIFAIIRYFRKKKESNE